MNQSSEETSIISRRVTSAIISALGSLLLTYRIRYFCVPTSIHNSSLNRSEILHKYLFPPAEDLKSSLFCPGFSKTHCCGVSARKVANMGLDNDTRGWIMTCVSGIGKSETVRMLRSVH